MTIEFRRVDGFATMPAEEASAIIYDELLPVCEEKNVKLSEYGNHNAPGSVVPVREYESGKAAKKLFNIERIRRVIVELNRFIKEKSTYSDSSYSLKHKIEDKQGEYLTNGDLIVAMLVSGYAARFAKKDEPLDVNCFFKVEFSEA